MKTRFYLLDIARGFAALFVVIYHYKVFIKEDISIYLISEKQLPFYDYTFFIWDKGWLAVQFFFILSGFIFHELYLEPLSKNKISFKKFFLLRFSRLYPLHLLTLLISAILFFLFDLYDVSTWKINGDLKHFFLNIFLLQSWGVENFQSFNEPSWSISIEIMCYFIFYYVSTKNFGAAKSSIILIILSLILYNFNKFIGYGIFCFFMGGITNIIYNKLSIIKKKLKKYFFIISLIGTLLSLAIFQVINNSIIEKILLLGVILPLLILTLMFYQENNIHFGNNFKFIGDISYSMYLNHFVLQMIIHLILNIYKLKIDFHSEVFFIFYILFIITTSFFSYNFYEKKIQNYLRKKYL
ncbi:acyltransferase [Candidatus Pelagibacter sp.]|nr:acyltransferase [Candidatus Pelagibacter sp.]